VLGSKLTVNWNRCCCPGRHMVGYHQCNYRMYGSANYPRNTTRLGSRVRGADRTTTSWLGCRLGRSHPSRTCSQGGRRLGMAYSHFFFSAEQVHIHSSSEIPRLKWRAEGHRSVIVGHCAISIYLCDDFSPASSIHFEIWTQRVYVSIQFLLYYSQNVL